MHYRHILEFEDNAELSAVHTLDGKVVVRVRSSTPKKASEEVQENHLYPLYCSRRDKIYQVSVGKTVLPVSRNVWEMFDHLNRYGRYVVLDNTEESARKAGKQLNAILANVGIRYRVVHEGSILKPEYLDTRAGI